MSKQILKGLTMVAVVLTIALVNAAVSNGQGRRSLQAEIPFAFTVGSSTLPAGSYTVRSANSQGEVLMISNRGQRKSIATLSHEVTDSDNNKACLVFHRYGDQYFLAQVWTGQPMGRELQKSKRQRAIERELANIASKADFAASGYDVIRVVAVLQK